MIVTRRAVAAGIACAPVILRTSPAQAQNFSAAFTREQATAAFAIAARGQARAMRSVGAVRGVVAPADDETPGSIEEVAAILADRRPELANSPRSALLFYEQRGGMLRAWLIDGTGLRAAAERPLADGALDQQSRDLRFWLNVDGRGVSRAPVFRWRTATPERIDSGAVDAPDLATATRTLAATLFPDEVKRGLAGIEHLWVIGSGAIGATPFPMLPLDRRTLLVDRMSVTIGAGLYDLRREIAPWSGQAAYAAPLILGDPLVPPDPMAVVIPPLPGARVEANALGELTRKPVIIGAEATKAAFLAKWREASLLYVAAHGVASADDPMEGSFLLLSGPDPAKAYLSAREVLPRHFDRRSIATIPALRLNARMAVLSACQTGLGMQHEGGVIGLARSFQWRGVPRVVMSLWSVSDDATVHLMGHFNRDVLTLAPAAALRQAMLKTRRRFPDPRLWAAFAVFGAPR